MRLDLFPLKLVLYPRMRVSLHVFEARYRTMIGRCIAENLAFGIVLIKEGEETGPAATPHAVGTTARIIQTQQLDNGRLNIGVVGEQRFRVEAITATTPHVVADVALWPFHNDDPAAVARARDVLRTKSQAGLALLLELQAGFNAALELPHDPERLALFVAAGLPVDAATKQALLETPSLDALLQTEIELVDQQIGYLEAMIAKRWAARMN
ncbi:MAG: LON peptidase substrate-binding domain-containing protein [Actinobacteria bacterium]|nr:LON peptidase substrate-binding domain-containing protein [Actinomycetota bacterium]